MLDIMAKMENGEKPVLKGRKRNKSFSDADCTNSTPAMMEVLKLKKLKSMDDANEELMLRDTPVALLSLPFKVAPVTITKDLMEEPLRPESPNPVKFRVPSDTRRKKSPRNTELKRLESRNSEPDTTERRRTRSETDDTKVQREIRSNLRNAFNYGLAPVRSFMRSVSNSLPKLF